jgi:multiple sugar transport system substrate-binding protein
MWIERTGYQEEWATSYGFHVPPRKSIAAKATKLQSGLPAEGVKLFGTYGHFDNPTWTPAMDTALQDVVAGSVRAGGDPGAALTKCDAWAVHRFHRLPVPAVLPGVPEGA